MKKVINTHILLVGKPERKKSLGRHRHRWKDIRIELRETGWKLWLRIGASDGSL
jgi:hypothetical protein